jgi:hypothetical protein
MTFVQMTFVLMTFALMTFVQMTFVQMTFIRMTFIRMTFVLSISVAMDLIQLVQKAHTIEHNSLQNKRYSGESPL